MHILSDLDGTLTDSSQGIVRCINHALTQLEYEPAPDWRLRGMIGAPLTAIFQTLLGSAETVLLDQAVAAYRIRYDDVGIHENGLVPGVVDALRELCERGHTLRIVTSKPTVTARRVLEQFEIAAFFEDVHGSAPDDRTCDKAQLVGAALRASGVNPSRVVVVGDRAEDILAARAHDVRAIAVTWGYGSLNELETARPTYVARSVAELVRWVQTAG